MHRHRIDLIQWGRTVGSLEFEVPDEPSPEYRRRVEIAVDSLAAVCCQQGYFDVVTTDVLTGEELDYETCVA